jgi:hypothetical protein
MRWPAPQAARTMAALPRAKSNLPSLGLTARAPSGLGGQAKLLELLLRRKDDTPDRAAQPWPPALTGRSK